MKKLLFFALLTVSAATMAQTTAGGANNGSSSSATTSAQGNNQAVTFSSPASTTNQTSLNSNQNIVNSGATQSTVDYQGSYTIKNVPSVNGPNLTTSNDTCMGSTSASANGPGVGLSFGTTWTDEHCKRLKMSRELWNKGMKAASLAMDCMDPSAQAALEMTGTKCPQSMTADERVSAYGPQASSTGAAPPVAARPVAQPVAMVQPAAVAPAPAPVPAPLPTPPAPVVQMAPAPQPVAQPVAAAPAEEPPAATTMPVASATVMPNDAGEASADRVTRRLAEPEPAAGDAVTAPQATATAQ
ncbi:hypothetical protein ACGLHS_16320 [Variovorax sp. VaC1]|uniref:hypothetical protein n=1 Tax=Variovorax sp. VaC1 TaxID=3373132 RepID=UPI00374A579A